MNEIELNKNNFTPQSRQDALRFVREIETLIGNSPQGQNSLTRKRTRILQENLEAKSSQTDVEQIASTNLKGARIEGGYFFGRRIVVAGRDETLKIKNLLKKIRGNLGSLDPATRQHAIRVLSELDAGYKTANLISMFSPTRKMAALLKQDLVKLEFQEDVIDKLRVEKQSPGLKNPFRAMLNCRTQKELLSCQREVIRLVLGKTDKDEEISKILEDEVFVNNLWEKIGAHPNLCKIRMEVLKEELSTIDLNTARIDIDHDSQARRVFIGDKDVTMKVENLWGWIEFEKKAFSKETLNAAIGFLSKLDVLYGKELIPNTDPSRKSAKSLSRELEKKVS